MTLMCAIQKTDSCRNLRARYNGGDAGGIKDKVMWSELSFMFTVCKIQIDVFTFYSYIALFTLPLLLLCT